jgi:hypothetical protein
MMENFSSPYVERNVRLLMEPVCPTPAMEVQPGHYGESGTVVPK